MKGGWVYLMSDRYRGGIYTGVTADLSRRVSDHRNGTGSEFVRKYRFVRLVYMEFHEEIENAIRREKAVKKWRRPWKIELIESMNPDWSDLFEILNN
ncbi:MAG: excinuclease ABC subunit C [Erythrobacter sp. RIFCSPHIGHO2_12_FULL_63_10]|nr:MAG: excinuclease ABC subunit C [Erythrobacter sp. RIFCSPHIGHO2_12_FULL_63_10]